MQLAGRLRLTTLGDVLGALYRGRATGILELTECSGSFAGRAHRIHLSHGLVREIESDLAKGARIIDTRLPPAAIDDARMQHRARLEALFRLPDARLTFRVADNRRAYQPVLPLGPMDFLHGRPRSRDGRRPDAAPWRRQEIGESGPRRRDPVRARALRTLGLPEHADVAAVSQAFRKLAASVHPDRYPGAAESERADLMRRFAELSAAYHALVG